MAAWTDRSYQVLETFFRDKDAGTYTLLMRPFALPRDGGGASRGGFMLEYGTGKMSDDARRIMFTHEMVHHFIGSLDGEPGRNAWFGEGLAEFYKARLPYRAGLLDFKAVTEEIEVMTNAYYTNAFVQLPIAEAGRLRWADRSIQSIPYNRGFMYFSDLNSRIVDHSKGKRSLGDLVLEMLSRRRTGQSYDERAWRDLLERELGEAGLSHFDDMLAGKLIVPASSAFGDCLQREEIYKARPVLGFEEYSLLVEPRVISDLQDGSAAARAGVQNGDRVIAYSGVEERIAHSASNVRLSPTVQLTLDGSGTRRDVSFSTEGPQIVEYRWRSKPGRAESCQLK